jgi:hypothetical protein
MADWIGGAKASRKAALTAIYAAASDPASCGSSPWKTWRIPALRSRIL